jgi:hypothetical protein
VVYRHLFFGSVLALMSTGALAIEVCDIPPRYGLSTTAQAIVRTTCNEHRLWYRPFIDRDGRIASLGASEADSGSLADNGVIAWQRVAGYWRESGTLGAMGSVPGAQSCFVATGNRYTDSDCRAFLIDNPWSAAFISWVMTRAGVTGFNRSPRHIDYIRAAYQSGGNGPYRLADPATEKPAPGDMLCFLRNRSTTLNYSGLIQALGNGSAGNWQSHCEIVVTANAGGDRTLHLVGGNVANSVVMRKLALGRTGLVELPRPDGGNTGQIGAQGCTPGNEEDCNLNRQDWAALLKLLPMTASPGPAVAPAIPAQPAATETGNATSR